MAAELSESAQKFARDVKIQGVREEKPSQRKFFLTIHISQPSTKNQAQL
ncbi:MAG: hypothetical protein NTV22_14410 [bacterium]|nr:hypothetical protein [bacterium]